MRLSRPRRIELGTESYDQERRKGLNSIHGPTERFQARGVGPMCVLKDHQHWLLTCQTGKLCRQRLQRSLSALLRCEVECWIASIGRQRQHLGKQRGVLFGGRGLCKQRIELVEFRLRGVVVRQPGGNKKAPPAVGTPK